MAEVFLVIRRRLGPNGMVAMSDGILHPTRALAIAHGEERTGSDDFNIGALVDGRLVRLEWMGQTVDADADELAEIQGMIALRGRH